MKALAPDSVFQPAHPSSSDVVDIERYLLPGGQVELNLGRRTERIRPGADYLGDRRSVGGGIGRSEVERKPDILVCFDVAVAATCRSLRRECARVFCRVTCRGEIDALRKRRAQMSPKVYDTLEPGS